MLKLASVILSPQTRHVILRRVRVEGSQILLFALVIFLGFCTSTVSANDKEPLSTMNDDMSMLVEQSELIALAHVLEVKKDLNQTRVKLAVDEVYKGPAETEEIDLQHAGGKHTVAIDEPSFTSYDKAILFLEKGPNGVWQCVAGARGKKTIYNDHVYVDPNNGFSAIDYKKYRKALTEKIAKLAAPALPTNA